MEDLKVKANQMIKVIMKTKQSNKLFFQRACWYYNNIGKSFEEFIKFMSNGIFRERDGLPEFNATKKDVMTFINNIIHEAFEMWKPTLKTAFAPTNYKWLDL